MGYMLPLRFIKVSNKKDSQKQYDVAICATRIVAIMSTEAYQARRAIHDEKKAGTLINGCGSMAAKSAVFLDNGAVVSSPLSVTVLMNAVARANQAASAKKTARMRVYDIYDDDPDEDTEEEDELSVEPDDYDDFEDESDE
mgnify:CR=1 FL=1